MALDEALVQVVGDRPTALALRPDHHAALRADLDRQVVHLDRLGLPGHHQPLEHVLQLAHVPGPRVLEQGRQRLRGHRARRVRPLAAEVGEEVLDQRRDVLLALAQGRDVQVNDVQAVVEILPERPLRDHLGQVPVGRGDHPDVHHAGRAVGADLLQFARLEEPQEQALHPQRHLADLVEEDRALVGELELALLVAVRAGEAALHVAEQLGLEERLRQPRAVDGHERPVHARARAVDAERHQLLAGPALARHQHLRVGPGDALDLGLEIEDGKAGADDLCLAIASHSRS
ncbi:MAG: hypothetical protein H6Q10_3761 [Acidobacteria bacterium]|nr:hypothetical protein [Acidobacteriota bacterium]